MSQTGNTVEFKTIAQRCLYTAVAIVLLDQFTKIIVEQNISRSITVIPSLFNLVHVKNTGAAWGMLAGKGGFLLAISVLVLFLIARYIRQLTEGWTERYYALALISGGILGNAIDRIWRGAVVDFLDFYIVADKSKELHWPAFNVADSAICVGVCIFILSSWFRPQINTTEKKEKNQD